MDRNPPGILPYACPGCYLGYHGQVLYVMLGAKTTLESARGMIDALAKEIDARRRDEKIAIVVMFGKTNIPLSGAIPTLRHVAEMLKVRTGIVAETVGATAMCVESLISRSIQRTFMMFFQQPYPVGIVRGVPQAAQYLARTVPFVNAADVVATARTLAEQYAPELIVEFAIADPALKVG